MEKSRSGDHREARLCTLRRSALSSEESFATTIATNAWIRHFRKSDPRLVTVLREHRVLVCDVVIGELLLGSGLPKGAARDLLALPRLPSPGAEETRSFIERHGRSFAGSGVGWADAQVILTAAKAGARLHTTDAAVRRLCRSLDVVLS